MQLVGDGDGETTMRRFPLTSLEKGFQKKYPALDVDPKPSAFCHLGTRF